MVKLIFAFFWHIACSKLVYETLWKPFLHYSFKLRRKMKDIYNFFLCGNHLYLKKFLHHYIMFIKKRYLLYYCNMIIWNVKEGCLTCAGLFPNKAAALQACNLIKKRLQHRCFPVKFAKFLRRPIWRTSANDWSKDMSIINANINVHIFLHENDVIFRWPYQFYDFGTVYLSFYLANCKKLAESSKLLNWLNS